MGKLLFFSDLHLEGHGVREQGLEEIVGLGNKRSIDEIIFGGDAIGNSTAMLAFALENDGIVSSAVEAYKKLSYASYRIMDAVLAKSEAKKKHGIAGNHDPAGIDENMPHLDFTPADDLGKVYLENMPLSAMGTGWDAITIPENKDYQAHALKKRPKRMLWHQGPYDVDYGNGNTFRCPEEFKQLGDHAALNLYGHNHSPFVKYDAEKKRLDINMTTADGFFAIVEYDEKYDPLAVEVYKNRTIAQDPMETTEIAQQRYRAILDTLEQQEDAA